jgi:GNAT superfamily N-acetyltransferase
MQSPIIRPAQLDERDDLHGIQVRVSLMWPDYRQRLLDDPHWIGVDEAHINEGRVLVLEAQGEPTGFAVVRPRDDGDADLRSYFIDPGTWGGEMPRLLMEAAVAHARANGAMHLWAYTTEDAATFYRNLGFERAGEVYTPQGPRIAMRRNLIGTIGNA